MIIISALMIICSLAQAADREGRYLISGIGKDSCTSFVDADDVGKAFYRTWFSGYITAHNFHAEETYSIVNEKSVQDLETWLRSYCFANLGNSFDQAVKALMRSLEYTKKKSLYAK